MMIIKRLTLCLVLLVALGLAENVERKILVREEPAYPELAQKMNLHGSVKLKLWVAPNGAVSRVEYIGGHPVLAEVSLSCVKKWKFEAAPKETSQIVEFKF
jgi:TonB family protein